MHEDKKYDIVRSDELILKFGSHLLKRVGIKGRHRIAVWMRTLAKLLHSLSKWLHMPDKPLSFFLDGTYFDAAIEAVEKVNGAGYDEIGQRIFAKTSIVTMTENLPTKCYGLKQGLITQRIDGEDNCKVDQFLTLFNSDWSDCMSCLASVAQKARTYNRSNYNQVLKLKQHTQTRLQERTKQLEVEPSYAAWRALSEIVLAQLVVFNKQRGGEPVKTLLPKFLNQHQSCNKE
jgi:hypothetical protein